MRPGDLVHQLRVDHETVANRHELGMTRHSNPELVAEGGSQ